MIKVYFFYSGAFSWRLEFSCWNPGFSSVLSQEVASPLWVVMWAGFLAPGPGSTSSFFLLSYVCLGLFVLGGPKTPHACTCVSGRSFGGAGRPQHSRPCPLHAGRSPLLGESIGEGWSDLTLTLLSSSGRHLSSLSLNFKDVFRISLGSSVGARVFRAGQ